MKILGIDEAGRGPVIGPMVICGYLIDEKNIKKLQKMGAKDSKLLTAAKRTSLEPGLRGLAEKLTTISISASQIDELRTTTNLNRIEIDAMQRIINQLNPDVAHIDAPEFNTASFTRKIRSNIGSDCELVCENFADRKYLDVSAASIMAKVERDAEIEKLHAAAGDFGSGYPSDPLTVEFLKNWIKDNKEFPDYVRKSWITAALLKREKEQKTLNGFART